MTIEEKAPYLDRANEYWYQHTSIIGLYSKENELDVKNAYIDGLKEGRKEKWHDLRKDPNDLPDHLHSVIVAYKNNSLGTLFTSQGYLGAMNIWNVDGFSPYEVIAWCELPMFEE